MPRRLPCPLGARFGRLTITGEIRDPKFPLTRWTYRCDCGIIGSAAACNIHSGNTKSCGCANKRSIVGKTFGQLTVVEASILPGSGSGSKKRVVWTCRCSCGQVVKVLPRRARHSLRSCGCTAFQSMPDAMLEELRARIRLHGVGAVAERAGLDVVHVRRMATTGRTTAGRLVTVQAYLSTPPPDEHPDAPPQEAPRPSRRRAWLAPRAPCGTGSAPECA